MRGRTCDIRCPQCVKNPDNWRLCVVGPRWGKQYRSWGASATGGKRDRIHQRGRTTGAASRHQYEVICGRCNHRWWSRHPEAKMAYRAWLFAATELGIVKTSEG